jgi:tRNA nucleotidyltransferase (CCA-adding enzyme)
MKKGLDFSIDKSVLENIRLDAKNIVLQLQKSIKSLKIRADVFIGGSLAKNTLSLSENYDIDIFIRFDISYSEEQLSSLLEKIVKSLKLKYEKVHGSRDYFRISKENTTFEIIPVVKINHPKKARNTTDLSYFHVNYVKSKLSPKLINDVILTKRFFKAAKVYGAESYVSGFSGYACECLIICYKSFDKMISSFLKAKEKIILDPKNYYKKSNILLEMNESKTHSPIVLVDPTFKERNVLAALSQETFDRLKDYIKLYQKSKKSKPDSFFEINKIEEEDMIKEARKTKAEYLKITLSTNRQEGDIAGTKLKKFSSFIIAELSKSFDIVKSEFEYNLSSNADIHLIIKQKKNQVRVGPPLTMVKAVEGFRKANKNAFIKNKKICVKLPSVSPKAFILAFKNKYRKQIADMDIINLTIN